MSNACKLNLLRIIPFPEIVVLLRHTSSLAVQCLPMTYTVMCTTTHVHVCIIILYMCILKCYSTEHRLNIIHAHVLDPRGHVIYV